MEPFGIAAVLIVATIAAGLAALVVLLFAVRMIRRTVSLIRKLVVVGLLFTLTTAAISAAVAAAVISQAPSASEAPAEHGHRR